MSDTILKLEDITKIYPNGTVANRNINIELRKGEIHSIVGENGAGKSTLMKIIFAIEKQTSGKIYYKGEEINYQGSVSACRCPPDRSPTGCFMRSSSPICKRESRSRNISRSALLGLENMDFFCPARR